MEPLHWLWLGAPSSRSAYDSPHFQMARKVSAKTRSSAGDRVRGGPSGIKTFIGLRNLIWAGRGGPFRAVRRGRERSKGALGVRHLVRKCRGCPVDVIERTIWTRPFANLIAFSRAEADQNRILGCSEQ